MTCPLCGAERVLYPCHLCETRCCLYCRTRHLGERTEERESMMQRLLLVVMLAGLAFLFLAAVAILLT